MITAFTHPNDQVDWPLDTEAGLDFLSPKAKKHVSSAPLVTFKAVGNVRYPSWWGE